MDKELSEYIGSRISKIRGNITARSLSLNLGQSPNYINQIENGKTLPSLDNLKYICDYFNISMHEFFEEVEISEREIALRQQIATLSDDEMDILIQTAKLFNKNKKANK